MEPTIQVCSTYIIIIQIASQLGHSRQGQKLPGLCPIDNNTKSADLITTDKYLHKNKKGLASNAFSGHVDFKNDQEFGQNDVQ